MKILILNDNEYQHYQDLLLKDKVMCELDEICQRVLVPYLSKTPNEVNKELGMVIQSVQSTIILKSMKSRDRDDILIRYAGISALEVVRKKIE